MSPLLDWLLLMPLWKFLAGKKRLVIRAVDEEKGIDKTRVTYLSPTDPDDKELLDILDEVDKQKATAPDASR